MDFITQVKRPGEEEPTKPTMAVESSSSSEEDSCFFGCCFGGNKKKKRSSSKNTSSKNTSSKPVGGLAVPTNGVNRDSSPMNSPRISNALPVSGNDTGDVHALLGPQRPERKGRKCLVLDLDETLVHSSFQEVERYDFKISVEIENVTYTVFVAKRPGVDEFMKRMGEVYEVVVFTASLSKYADPVLDLLDIHKVVDWRLFREHCTFVKNTYVKDMGRMGRPITSVMIIDNSPHSYAFNPENAIPCDSWFEDVNDRELYEFIPILTEISKCDNVIKELEARKMNGYSAVMGIENDGSDTSDYYSTTQSDSYTSDSYSSESNQTTDDSANNPSGTGSSQGSRTTGSQTGSQTGTTSSQNSSGSST